MTHYDDEDDGGESADGDEQEIGTILRPLRRRDGYQAPWERDPLHKMKQTWDPTVRWGDAVVIDPQTDPALPAQTADLLNIQLKHAQTCRIGYHAEVVETSGSFPQVTFSEVELHIGCGSQLSVVRRAFVGLPQLGGIAVDLTWEQPLNGLRGRVSLRGVGCKVRFSLWAVPIVGRDG
jgi:hypothetical protein